MENRKKEKFIPYEKVGDVWFNKDGNSYLAWKARHEIPLKLYGFALGFEDVQYISPKDIKAKIKKR